MRFLCAAKTRVLITAIIDHNVNVNTEVT